MQLRGVRQGSRVHRARVREPSSAGRSPDRRGELLEAAGRGDLQRPQRLDGADEERVRQPGRQQHEVARPGSHLLPVAEECGPPAETRNISSSTVCRCSGGAKPGGLKNSTTVTRPPVSAPVALTVTRLPRNQTASPSSARRSRGRGVAGADMGAPCRRRTLQVKGRTHAERLGSAPAELVQALVVDAEVVRDLVDDGDRHLVDDVVLGLADVADGSR